MQRLIGDTIWTSETGVIDEWDKDYQLNFDRELKEIKDKPPVDAKDEFAREEMLNYAHDCIGITKKVVQDIVGEEKLQCERAVRKMFDEIGCPDKLKECQSEIKRHKMFIQKQANIIKSLN